MNGDTWPKEEQRLCNGACGKVRIAARADGFPSGEWLDLDWLRHPPTPKETATPEHAAIDVADNILCESTDMAQHVIGHSASVRREVLAFAEAHSAIAARVYAAQLVAEALRGLTDALRETAPEVAGAISEAGTDIGAGLAEGLERAGKGRPCRRGT